MREVIILLRNFETPQDQGGGNLADQRQAIVSFETSKFINADLGNILKTSAGKFPDDTYF